MKKYRHHLLGEECVVELVTIACVNAELYLLN